MGKHAGDVPVLSVSVHAYRLTPFDIRLGGDELLGAVHGDVPQGHELGFGPVGAEAKGSGAKAEERDKDGAGLLQVADDKSTVVKIELEVDKAGGKVEAAAADEGGEGNSEKVGR